MSTHARETQHVLLRVCIEQLYQGAGIASTEGKSSNGRRRRVWLAAVRNLPFCLAIKIYNSISCKMRRPGLFITQTRHLTAFLGAHIV
jgi:hypothetical protein